MKSETPTSPGADSDCLNIPPVGSIEDVRSQLIEATSKLEALGRENRLAWSTVEEGLQKIDQLYKENRLAWSKVEEGLVNADRLTQEMRAIYRSRHLIAEQAKGLLAALEGRDRLLSNVTPEQSPHRKKLREMQGRTLLDARAANELGSSRIWAPTSWGSDMALVLPERVSEIIAEHGEFEPSLTRLLQSMLHSGDIFFDVGAHIGYFSLLAAQLVGAEGKVVAFEPTESTRQILLLNTMDTSSIEICSDVVWSVCGSVSFGVNTDLFSAFNSVFDARLDEGTRSHFPPIFMDLPSITIDKYVEKTGLRPSFIKVDAESSEREIIRGARKTLRRDRPLVTLEVGDIDSEKPSVSAPIFDDMMESDYVPFEIHNTGIRKHGIKQRYKIENILFIPKEKEADFSVFETTYSENI
jgi:FkbM family methyltransferase